MTRAIVSLIVLMVAPGAALAAEPFVGKWVNVDDQTKGFTRLEITKTKDGLFLRAWGAIGVGGENDLGKVPLKPLSDSVGSREMKYGYAEWKYDFKDTHVTLDLEKPWLLTLDDFNIFKDNSDRSDYRMRWQFKRVNEPVD